MLNLEGGLLQRFSKQFLGGSRAISQACPMPLDDPALQELIARLARLEAFIIERPEFQGSYHRDFTTPFTSPWLPCQDYPELEPYKQLKAERLLLRGTQGVFGGTRLGIGHWPSNGTGLESVAFLITPFAKVTFARCSTLKNEKAGDRRIPNSRERTSGEPAFLPSAVQLCVMLAPRWTHAWFQMLYD